MTRLRGRCERGKRLRFLCPHGHWRTVTMISSIRLDGSTACMTIDGATDTETFPTSRVVHVSGQNRTLRDIKIENNLFCGSGREAVAVERVERLVMRDNLALNIFLIFFSLMSNCILNL